MRQALACTVSVRLSRCCWGCRWSRCCWPRAQPWLVKTLIDDGLLARDYQTLWHMAALMIGAGVLGTVPGVNRYLHTRLSGRILFALVR